MKIKEHYLIFTFAAILFIIMVGITVLFFTTPSSPPPSGKTILPTASVPRISTAQGEPTNASDQPVTNPPFTLNKKAVDSLVDKLVHKRPLSPDDATAKTKILSLLPTGETSGIVYRTDNFSIDYTKGPDSFMVEIVTPSIDQAKKEANTWFLSQGMSQEGICNYPIQFYLNFDIAEQLRSQNLTFNPLAPGCN